jgi:hypothetical protein
MRCMFPVFRGHWYTARPGVGSRLKTVRLGFSTEWGLFYAIQCMDEYPFNDPDVVVMDRDRIAYMQGWHTLVFGADQAVCAELDLPPTTEDFRQPVIVDVPALILAGSYDPITPPSWGEKVADNLPVAYFHEFPSESHVTYFENACARKMVATFLDDPTTPPDTCPTEDNELIFVSDDDIIVTRAFYRLNTEFERPEFLLPTLLPAMTLILFIGHALSAFVPSLRGSTLHRLATIVALLGVAIVLSLVFILFTMPEIILGFGLPPAGIITGILLLTQVLAWIMLTVWLLSRIKQADKKNTVYYTFFTLASAAFIIWLGWMYAG